MCVSAVNWRGGARGFNHGRRNDVYKSRLWPKNLKHPCRLVHRVPPCRRAGQGGPAGRAARGNPSCLAFPENVNAIKQCKIFPENSIYVFLEKEMRGLSPHSYIHVSVSDFYIPRIDPHIWLQQNRHGRILEIYKSLTNI